MLAHMLAHLLAHLLAHMRASCLVDPIHAVAANGLRDMYDLLTHGLPAQYRAEKLQQTELGRNLTLNVDAMTPLQLTARRGLRYMHQHIMKVEHTRILWVWGPVTQYQLELEGIDSSGEGASDVMEILTREDASTGTKEFVLDTFMGGFLFQLYRQKWEKFGWYLHLILTCLDAAVVALVVRLCIGLKQETDKREMQGTCWLTVKLISAFLGVEVSRTHTPTSACVAHGVPHPPTPHTAPTISCPPCHLHEPCSIRPGWLCSTRRTTRARCPSMCCSCVRGHG